MINPHELTNYNRTHRELEELLLFSMAVAGKRATVISRKIDLFLKDFPKDKSIFKEMKERISIDPNWLDTNLRRVKLGRYRDLNKGFPQLAHSDLDLKKCSLEALESIHGISHKTSRMFILHSRPDIQESVLDTHILHWLRDLGYETPKASPSGKKYKEIQEIFLEECKKRDISPAELDLQIWKTYTKSKPLDKID